MTTIRVVEDSWDIADWLAIALKTAGHTVLDTRHDFADLLHKEPWEAVDVAIVDLHLGEATSGREVLEYLATNLPDIRRIVFSAYPRLIEDNASLADVTLVKPASIEQILGAVQ